MELFYVPFESEFALESGFYVENFGGRLSLQQEHSSNDKFSIA